MTDYTLCGGPQDGGRVKEVGGWIGDAIYVGPKPLGDGFAAWSRSSSRGGSTPGCCDDRRRSEAERLACLAFLLVPNE